MRLRRASVEDAAVFWVQVKWGRVERGRRLGWFRVAVKGLLNQRLWEGILFF